MATIKLFLKNLLITMMTAGLFYHLGVNDYVDFPKNYPFDHLLFALSILMCSMIMTYNELQTINEIKKEDEIKR
jgi:hypothetical protein